MSRWWNMNSRQHFLIILLNGDANLPVKTQWWHARGFTHHVLWGIWFCRDKQLLRTAHNIMRWFDATLAAINSDETGPCISMNEGWDYEERRRISYEQINGSLHTHTHTHPCFSSTVLPTTITCYFRSCLPPLIQLWYTTHTAARKWSLLWPLFCIKTLKFPSVWQLCEVDASLHPH